MSAKTGIEWTDATWNPVTGCTKVSQGCKNCYAERVFPRAYGHKAEFIGMSNKPYYRKFTDVKTHDDRLDQPLRWRRPRKIFVNSMSDLFHEDVSFEFVAEIFCVMASAPAHTFQVLTKRPARMLAFLSQCKSWGGWITHNGNPVRHAYDGDGIIVGSKTWPLPNVWLGVSVEDQATADERIPLLLKTPAAVLWISAEPLIGPVDLSRWIHHFPPGPLDRNGRDAGGMFSHIQWCVVGGESGPNARPMHPDWVRSLRDQCRAADVAYFFKQWGEWAPADDYPSEIQESYDIRGLTQDMSVRVGKKRAGRMLDGRTWDEYPT